MNKKILAIACLVMITTTLSGCNLLGGDKNKETTKKNTSAEQNQESEKSDKKNNKDGNYFETMKDLMARGKSMKCTYAQQVDSENTANGVVYMADGNARVEIIANKGTAHEGKMYSITDNKWVYSWPEGSHKGFKMTLEASELSEKQEETVSDLSKEIDFKCKSWKKDNSKFKAPSNIVFEDMSEMMEGFEDIDLEQTIKDAETQANKFICDHCKNAPASEQAECLGDVVCDWSE